MEIFREILEFITMFGMILMVGATMLYVITSIFLEAPGERESGTYQYLLFMAGVFMPTAISYIIVVAVFG